jgi:hypothetical protein
MQFEDSPVKTGHNNPPSPIDEALAPFVDDLSEAESWLDGSPVENEGQMKAVDALLKQVKAAKKAVEAAEESESKPIYQAWKDAKAKYAPKLTDLDKMAKGLLSIVDGFKRKMAAEKAEAERVARAAAEKAMREAKEAAEKANAANIEEQRAAEAAKALADEAAARAREASKDTVKGLRTVWHFEVTDTSALLRWINKNDRDALNQFAQQYAQSHHRHGPLDGVRSWSEKEAF